MPQDPVDGTADAADGSTDAAGCRCDAHQSNSSPVEWAFLELDLSHG